MADLFIGPGCLAGKVTPPPSKSMAHRALIAAALGGAGAQVTGLGKNLSDDIRATRDCLAALLGSSGILDCKESGTTLRLLLPLAGAVQGAGQKEFLFTGQGRLPRRPLGDYAGILAGAGLKLERTGPDQLPLLVSGSLQPGRFAVPGNVSSQYISGLLFALPLLAGSSSIVLTTELESAPYVEMTLAVLDHFGIKVAKTKDGYKVPGGQKYQAAGIEVEKDYSQAAFWLVAAYGGCRLQVDQLPGQTKQGDRAIVDILQELSNGTEPLAIDVAQVPDLVPALAVAAALTPRQTHLVNGARLRYKESDRLESTRSALAAIGADIRLAGDQLHIRGGGPASLTGGTTDSWGDHRIAMAVAVAALFTQKGVTLKNSGVVSKSYPDFFVEFRRLGGALHELNLGK